MQTRSTNVIPHKKGCSCCTEELDTRPKKKARKEKPLVKRKEKEKGAKEKGAKKKGAKEKGEKVKEKVKEKEKEKEKGKGRGRGRGRGGERGRGRGGGRGRGRGRGKEREREKEKDEEREGTEVWQEERGEKMNYAAVKFLVERALPPNLLPVWFKCLITDKRIETLWGIAQPQDFIQKMLVLAIYKDLTGEGYDKLVARVDFGFEIHGKSLNHNTKVIRRILFQWAKKQIVNKGSEVWNKSAKLFPYKSGLEDVNLTIDSSDFRLSGKASTSRKDPDWSFKLNSPGQRFQMLCDAHGSVQKLWGGYSPKIYDGDWIKILKETLVEQFEGAHIIADTHFETGNRTMKDIGGEEKVKFYHPISHPRGRKRKKTTTDFDDDPSCGQKKLTAAQTLWNEKVSHIRARVESPFGLVKQKWGGLGGVFYEDKQQQNYLVYIAIGVHNYTLEPPK
jgi:DDE superfamily endonuclease